MTVMCKICPNSGTSCDCPKGQCLQQTFSAEVFSANTIRECYGTTEKSTCECPDICAENGCQVLRAVGATDAEITAASSSVGNQQTDSLEAHSIKYQACAQITLLSSGKFALFGAYRAGGGSGIELLAIGTWEELEPHVREYRQLADAAHARGQERTLPAKTAADYDSLFGEN